MYRIIIGISFCFFMSCSAFADNSKIYFCWQSGSTTYSDKPCALPPTDPMIQPIRSKVIDKELVDRTVKMLRKTFLTKDIHALERLLSTDFKFLSRDKNWNGKVLFDTDRGGFVELCRDHLLAMSSYEQKILNYSISQSDGDFVSETKSYEKVTLGGKLIEANLVERLTFGIENGVIKITSVNQIEL